jgi:molybdate transport system substrate-binding protein
VRRWVIVGGCLLVGLVALAVGTTRAGSGGGRSSGGGALALAAASLTDVLPRIAPESRFSFGGSNRLAQQISLGAPFDVYFSASPTYTRRLFAEGLVRKPVVFATNELVMIVPRSNPAHITSLTDLGRRSRLRLVAAGPKVPIGSYTRQVLERVGMVGILRTAVSLEPDVKGIVAKVALGEADAGFVYTTDVSPVRGRVRAIRIPAIAQPTVRYELAVARNPVDQAAARVLVGAVLGRDGRRELRAAGFGTS